MLTNIKLLSKIAHGAFGEIYEGIDRTSNTKLAIKLEKPGKPQQLRHEYLIYRRLAGPHTPQVYEYGQIIYKDQVVECMTMELLNTSLEKLFVSYNRKFSVKTVLMIGKACLNRIESLHHKHLLHRDIKPDNFVTDATRKKIYLIDYGLAKYYRNPETLMHVKMRGDKTLVGTARYASLSAHQGMEQGRRDDLESLGFMLAYFLRGSLPWQGLKAKTVSEKYSLIRKVKEETSIFELCYEIPEEIYLYLVHVRNLQFNASPDYAYLESLLEAGLRARGLEDDGMFDWIVGPPPGRNNDSAA